MCVGRPLCRYVNVDVDVDVCVLRSLDQILYTGVQVTCVPKSLQKALIQFFEKIQVFPKRFIPQKCETKHFSNKFSFKFILLFEIAIELKELCNLAYF